LDIKYAIVEIGIPNTINIGNKKNLLAVNNCIINISQKNKLDKSMINPNLLVLISETFFKKFIRTLLFDIYILYEKQYVKCVFVEPIKIRHCFLFNWQQRHYNIEVNSRRK
jgi:hypothetical protein